MEDRTMQTRSLVLALVPCLWLFTGCVQSERRVYIKPDVTEAQRKQDQEDCVRSSIEASEAERRLFAVVPINREAFNKCMEARGYSALPRR
jgi:hypothetical protein